MMREIGSEFWDVPVSGADNGIFPENTGWFLSGRSALSAILRGLNGCRTAALPSWCCDSMVKPFTDAGIGVKFYPVYFDGKRLVSQPRADCDILFLIDYFGYTGDTRVSGYRGTVIRDVTHSVFSARYDDADFFFGSLRKWCGVWTGGFAFARDGRAVPAGNADGSGYAALRKEAMEQKKRYIEAGGDKGYIALFGKAEELLDHAGVSPAEQRDVELAKTLDVRLMISRRRENAGILRAAFPEMLIFPKMKETDCPLFVPVLVPDGRRDAVRKHLIGKEIYCPVHWGVSEYHRLSDREKNIYDNELSLVCDQRYSKEDMLRTVEAVKEALNC